MSEMDEYADPEVYMDELEESCDYGLTEFCEHPDLKENGMCTTECPVYLEALEEQMKRRTIILTWDSIEIKRVTVEHFPGEYALAAVDAYANVFTLKKDPRYYKMIFRPVDEEPKETQVAIIRRYEFAGITDYTATTSTSDRKTLKLMRKGDVCALEIQIKASNPELQDQTAEKIRKYLTTQQEWSEIGSTGR